MQSCKVTDNSTREENEVTDNSTNNSTREESQIVLVQGRGGSGTFLSRGCV